MKRIFLSLLLVSLGIPSFGAEPKPNILFIAIDDLRPELASYGASQIVSPHIDKLATEGIVFTRAYCQLAVCGPSRLSVMTGRHLESLGVFDMSARNLIEWRDTRKGVTSLPEQFRKSGYHALSLGKIYDYRLGYDDGHSWDAMGGGRTPHFASPENVAKEAQMNRDRRSGAANPQRRPAFESFETDDETYTDGACAKQAVEFLDTRDRQKPFFLAVGFVKPHLPFVAPKKYWDLYRRDEIELPANQQAPSGSTPYTLSPYKEINDYDAPATIDDDAARELRHGYYACVSYVDAQVGKLVEALKRNGDWENTIVVLWGDHGFKLGDFGDWAKHTNLETDTRVPLIFRLPNGAGAGKRSESLVELIDIFPTLCEAANLDTPPSAQGKSLLPIFRDPTATIREFALSQYPRGKAVMGYSLRSADWRYTEWIDRTTGETVERELYRLRGDNLMESQNVASENQPVADKYSAQLHEFLKTIPKWEGEPVG